MSKVDVDWMHHAACKQHANDLFYPDYNLKRSVFLAIVNDAKQICNTCPVQTDCLNYALEWEMIGIWGGMTETERNRYRRTHHVRLSADAHRGGKAR